MGLGSARESGVFMAGTNSAPWSVASKLDVINEHKDAITPREMKWTLQAQKEESRLKGKL